MSKEPPSEVGRVLFSYAGNDKPAKRETAPRPGRFVLEARDRARLLPRLQGSPRR